MSARAHLMRGNASKKPLGELLDEIQLLVEVPDCPKHLWPEARKEWRRAGVELADAGLIAKIDRAAFALYCQAWAELVWHKQQYTRDIERLQAKRDAFEAAEAAKVEAAIAKGGTYVPAEWVGGDGLMMPTPNGSFTYNPHWVASNKAADQVDKFAASFGMSGPSSRVRVQQSNNYYLPGMEPTKGAAAPATVTSLADFKKPTR